MRALWLWRGNRESWGLVPALLYRVERFAKTYGEDYPEGLLSSMFVQSFCSDAPKMAAIVGLEGMEIDAHLLAQIETWGGRSYVGIVQLEADERIPRELFAESLSALEAWGSRFGATGFTILCGGEARSRLFRRLGFKEKHRHMVRPFLTIKDDLQTINLDQGPPTPTVEEPVHKGTDTVYEGKDA